MNCTHQFHTIEQTHRAPAPQTPTGQTAAPIAQRWNDMNGVRVGCALCGEIRVVWANGDLVVELKGHDHSTGN